MVRYISLIEEKDTLARIEKRSPEEPDLLLSLRAAGDMANIGARQALLESFSIPPVARVKQVHSKRVLWAGGQTGGQTGDGSGDVEVKPEADGLLSGGRGNFLGVTVADCMPVYLFGSGIEAEEPFRREVFGILHSGWKGTGIARVALEEIQKETGIPPKQMTAVLGPSIRSCCYRVDGKRAELFASLWGGEAVRKQEKSGGEYPGAPGSYLDLVQANVKLLEEQGVEDIRVVDACTQCDERFGSYRREGPETFTHMLAMIGYLQ